MSVDAGLWLEAEVIGIGLAAGRAGRAVQCEVEGRGMEWRLRAGLMVPIAAWGLHLLAMLVLRPLMCTQWEPLVHLATVLAAASAATGGWLGYRSWLAVGGGYDVRGVDADTGRRRFLALGGMVLALICGLTIVGQWMTALVFSPCRT